MELVGLLVVAGLAVLGFKLGRYFTLLTMVILTAAWGLILASMPSETLAWVISLVWMVPGGAFVLGAWIGYLSTVKGSDEVVEKVAGLFIKDGGK